MIWLAVGCILAIVLIIQLAIAAVYYKRGFETGYNKGWEDRVLGLQKVDPSFIRALQYQATCPFDHAAPEPGTLVTNGQGDDVGVVLLADEKTVKLYGGSWITYSEMARRNWRFEP